ncbi:MAG: hypothetical protein BMS9Abin29_1000 [Gemmatimonadota bacterium]|nr:MAG: hypothetical protein BMS9Abin29_1000 [Gemmatimonadota bacterium]
MFRGNFLSPFLSVVCLLAFVPAGQAQVSADRLVAIMGFQVDLGLGGDVDSAWESLQGGELGIAVASATTGRDRVQAAAGYTYVGELALSGAVTSGRLAMTDWLNSVIRGLEWKRTVTTTEVLRDGSPGMSRSYFDAFPVRYVFPELSASGTGNLTETLVVKPMRVEMAGGSRGAAQSANEVLENGAGRFGVDLDGLPDASSRIRGVAVDDLTIDTREMTRGTARGFRAYGPGTVNTGKIKMKFERGRKKEV